MDVPNATQAILAAIQNVQENFMRGLNGLQESQNKANETILSAVRELAASRSRPSSPREHTSSHSQPSPPKKQQLLDFPPDVQIPLDSTNLSIPSTKCDHVNPTSPTTDTCQLATSVPSAQFTEVPHLECPTECVECPSQDTSLSCPPLDNIGSTSSLVDPPQHFLGEQVSPTALVSNGLLSGPLSTDVQAHPLPFMARLTQKGLGSTAIVLTHLASRLVNNLSPRCTQLDSSILQGYRKLLRLERYRWRWRLSYPLFGSVLQRIIDPNSIFIRI